MFRYLFFPSNFLFFISGMVGFFIELALHCNSFFFCCMVNPLYFSFDFRSKLFFRKPFSKYSGMQFRYIKMCLFVIENVLGNKVGDKPRLFPIKETLYCIINFYFFFLIYRKRIIKVNACIGTSYKTSIVIWFSFEIFPFQWIGFTPWNFLSSGNRK